MRRRESLASLEEVRALVRELPGADDEAAGKARAREAELTKPQGALGRLEALSQWLAAWQGRHPPRIEHPRACVFAGNHGIAAKGVSAYPAEVTAEMVKNFIDGGAAVNQLCRVMEADLRIYEMALEEPTRDFTEGPAMDDAVCAKAMAYGMMVVEPGIDVVCLGEMGIGNTTAAAAISLALFGGEAADWVGPGSGVTGARLRRKLAAVRDAVELHAGALSDPLEVMRRLGGQELAAIAGAVIAARLARTPVLLDGYAATAAAAVLYTLDPGLLDHCQAAHRSAEPGHGRLLEAIGKEPILDLGLRLGEATGAVLALGVLKGACACHAGMATFRDAGVSGKLD